jgi:protoporphyrinogen oxidase
MATARPAPSVRYRTAIVAPVSGRRHPFGGGRVAIVGAGPCGLACARELERLGHSDWRIFEASTTAGGHASSVYDEQGFTWDLGGHVVFSHYGEFDALLDEVIGDDAYAHERSSYIHLDGRWIPYPFQNNLRHLTPERVHECLLGLIEAPGGSADLDFASWIDATFGAGIARHFMRPYNFKVWATPLERMSSTWIAERVSVVDYRRALRNVLFELDDVGWGPNNRFRFPKTGGTGEIYRRLADRLGDRVVFEKEVVAVDPGEHFLTFADGTRDEYAALVSTMPVDRLVEKLQGCPTDLRRAAQALEHTGVYVVGVGYRRPLEDDRCWMYFPEDSTPFYRVTNFAKYSPANVPEGDTARFSSFLTETSYSRYKPERPEAVAEATVEGLVTVGLVEPDADVVSVHVIDVEYAYPVPTLGRDRALEVIQPWLAAHDIYSRGRFGSWRYEIGNMDHAVKMGIDAARRVLDGSAEEIVSV